MVDRVLERSSRRGAILEALAQALESHPGHRITTAELARSLSVSEAALYRHFPSKARMFEGLLDFAEETVFGRINLILEQEPGASRRIEHILRVVLGFAERNPGITRLLVGDALTGEAERLRTRVMQFFERIETQFRQLLREAALRQPDLPRPDAAGAASLLTAVLAGRLALQVQSGFRKAPTEGFDEWWADLQRGLFGAR